MTDSLTTWAYDDGDVDTNLTDNPTLSALADERYSRRQALLGGASAAVSASMLAGCNEDGAGAGAGSGPPVTVSAGSNAATSSGRAVVLSGTAQTMGTSMLQWTQQSGPTVTLVNATMMEATFVAPSVTAATDLTFQFTATTPGGRTSSATTTVRVNPATLGFAAVAKSRLDVVTVPADYRMSVLYRLGDPIGSAGAYTNDGSDSNFAQRAGDHHDGMYYFGMSASGTPDANNSERGLLALNHENITQAYLHPGGPTSSGGVRPYAEVIKEIEAHGVSVLEVVRDGLGAWTYRPTSTFSRRITPLTPVQITGPARGAPFMRTAFSPDGTMGRGTINNCASGFTRWSTYLTAEENWSGYFRRDASDVAARPALALKQQTSLARYGRGAAAAGNYGWTTATPPTGGDTSLAKFNITLNPAAPADGTGDFRHEIFQYGWVVEIDPYDPASVPRKRTALGRMNHEGAEPGRFVSGVKPAWYLGDDAVNEYFYKFVSATPWTTADANATNRLQTGDRYLDTGTLYVARFDADGTGQWLPLVFGSGPLTSANATYPFADQADVLANARLAGDVLGATRMDRPEWTATNHATGEIYLTLTNNSTRTVANTNAANPRAYTDPRTTGGATNGNPNGHIIRLRETGDSTEATSFAWDIYAFGAGRDLDPTNINLSGLDDSNDFSSPDGLWFSRPQNAGGLVRPLLWIQTDDGAYVDVTNCMLLVGQPGTVGDGGTRTITNTIGGTSGTQATRVGATPGGNLRRFLVGPKECEITGIDSTPDGRALFVNIQHPGENGTGAAPSSNWPQSQSGTASGRPRSATIVITRADGGVVGL